MEVNLEKINKIKIKPVKFKDEDLRPIKGEDMVTELYSQIFIVAKKNSGKSTVLYNLIPKLTDKTTKIYAFCSSIYQDKIWKHIKESLKEKNIEFKFFDSIIDCESGENNLAEILDEIKTEKKLEEEEVKDERKQKLTGILFDDSDDEEKKERKKKYRVPEYLFIFDDISGELKNSTLLGLLKKNRHFKSKVIISSQYPYDLLPESRKQIDLWLFFQGETEAKLLTLYKDMDSSLEFNQFYQLYKKATEIKYDFFYCDARLSDYRINFDLKFILNN
jgi:hypothetical protein